MHDTVGPLPVRLPRTTSRQSIRHRYVRTVIFSHKNGTERTRHFMAGFETTNDQQFDLSGPHPTEAAALQSAYEFTILFNQSPGLPPLEIRRVDQIPPFRQRLSRLLNVLLWTALTLATLFAGFLWEMNYQQSRRSKSANNASHATRSAWSSRQLASYAANAPTSITNSAAVATVNRTRATTVSSAWVLPNPA